MSGGTTGTPAVAVSASLTVATPNSAPFVLERISGPEAEPILLAEMKTHLRGFVSVTTLDDEITRMIVESRQWVEEKTGRALIDQTWRITINTGGPVGGDSVSGYASVPGYSAIGWDHWRRRGEILLRKSPVLAITSFVTSDSAGAETAIDPTTYALCEPDSKWPRIVALSGANWTLGALKVEFRAGFADRLGSPQEGAEVIPVVLLRGMKLYCSAMYDTDEKMMPLLLETAERLIKTERSELQLA